MGKFNWNYIPYPTFIFLRNKTYKTLWTNTVRNIDELLTFNQSKFVHGK